MKYIILVMLSFVSITLALSADVSSNSRGWYVQPSAVYLLPKGDYRAGLGAALSAGYNFDSHHAVEVELMNFKAETAEHFNAGYSYKTDLSAMPVLLTYRYSIGVGNGVSFFGGVSSGVSRETEDHVTTYPGGFSNLPGISGVYHYSDTNNRVVYGGQFGVSYDYNPRMSAVMALKVLRAEGSSGPSGYTTLQLGLKYRF